MSNNNDQVFNAALGAFMGGALHSSITDATDADYAGIADAASAFATRVDSKIPTDSAIATPLTAAGNKKVILITQICAGVMAGRYPNGTNATTPATYDANASAIAAAYRQAVTELA